MIDISEYTNSPIKIIPNDYCPKADISYFRIKSGVDRGKRMFYRDSVIKGKNPEKCIVFVHGNPECSYTYRHIIERIVKRSNVSCRIIAMDHIGFGISDQATHEMVSMDHADNLLQLIRKLDLQNVTLVVHDWGGPIGIGAFLKEPERLSNLVILNTTVFPIPNKGITFRNYPISWLGWCYTPYIIPDRLWGNFAAFAIFSNPNRPIPLLSNMLKNLTLMEMNKFLGNDIKAQMLYRQQFQSKINVESSKRLVKQTKSWGHGNFYNDKTLGRRSTKSFYSEIQKNITSSWGPNGLNIGVKAIIGRWDPLGQNNVIKQWISHLPQLKNNLKVYHKIGHFVEEIRPKEIAESILNIAELKEDPRT